MINEKFEQYSVGSYASGSINLGSTDLFISHNWDREKMLATNYLGIKAGDVLYAKSIDKRVKFNNLKLRISYPPAVKTDEGGLHAFTNDLILPAAFHLDPVKYIVLSNQPFAATEDQTVTYTLPSGQTVTTSPLTPPDWNTGVQPKVETPAIAQVNPNPAATTTQVNTVKTATIPAETSSTGKATTVAPVTEKDNTLLWAIGGAVAILVFLKLIKII